MGNGHDTAFFSKEVGEEGRVYAFDIQAKALVSTAETLKNEGCPDNCTLICDSHSNVLNYVSTKICAGVFNLGYLPGGQNKQVTTLRPTTMEAVQAAISPGLSFTPRQSSVFLPPYTSPTPFPEKPSKCWKRM
jgi:hypothetical protein